MKRHSPIRTMMVGTALVCAAGFAAFAAGPAQPATPTKAPVHSKAVPVKVAMTNATTAKLQPSATKAAGTTLAKPAATQPVPAPKPAEAPKAATAVPGMPPATPPPLPKGVVLHYSFDQADPKGAVTDRGGQNNHGQATGARWIEKGKLGGGFEFSGASHNIKVANSPSLNPKQLTIATWFRTSRCDGVLRRIFEKHCEGGFALSVAGDTPGIPTRGKISMIVGGARPCASDYVITDGTWHHAAATYDGENVRLYIDGTPQQQVVAFRGQIPQTSDDLVIGLNVKNPTPQDPIQCFEGALDEIMIFNRALSAEEIKTLVLGMEPNAGKPLFSKNQVAGRLRQLKLLFEEGLLTDEFFEAKVSECEAAGQ